MTFGVSLLRVLVIDDQTHVRHWVRTVLKQAGISDVTEAEDGRDALAAVTAPGAWFDLIFCDLRMPERDGIETIRSFAALGLQSAIAIMSIEEERMIETAGMLGEAQGLHMLGTIPKPLTLEKLKPLLEKLRAQSVELSDEPVQAPSRDFPNAFARGELLFAYQPQVWMRSKKFAGVEALVRWKHPSLGLFAPSSFVEQMDEHAQHGAALVDFSLREAIACAGRWKAAGRELRVAVNLSVRAFDRFDLPERIEALAQDANVSSKDITLEVTESEVQRDAVKMIDVATRVRLKGCSLAIDDFGTGQSGLSMLQKLPFNALKIDRGFVHGCAESGAQRAVVEAALSLARNLKMTSVAEGVQLKQDWDLLDELGCDIAQGYFIARPMSEEGLVSWNEQWSHHRASR